jgi:chlorinating enzyme
MSQRLNQLLSQQEIQRYHSVGYIVPKYRLEPSYLKSLNDALNLLIAQNPNVRPEKLVNAHLVKSDENSIKGSSIFFELAMHKPIVDLVEQVLGPDIILWGCQVFCKPASEGYETPWHQDGHYWPMRPLANCTVWVALEPSHRANGCLRVIPGSHKPARLYEHLHEDREELTLNQKLSDGTFDENLAVDLELEPGEMSMHDVYMIHGAKANTSNQRRTGVALRYMPGSSVFHRDIIPADGKSGLNIRFANRPIWLLRGQDRTGQNDFNVGKTHA